MNSDEKHRGIRVAGIEIAACVYSVAVEPTAITFKTSTFFTSSPFDGRLSAAEMPPLIDALTVHLASLGALDAMRKVRVTVRHSASGRVFGVTITPTKVRIANTVASGAEEAAGQTSGPRHRQLSVQSDAIRSTRGPSLSFPIDLSADRRVPARRAYREPNSEVPL